MAQSDSTRHRVLTGLGVPFFWPMLIGAQIGEKELELYLKNLKFLAEEEKIHHPPRPEPATANRVLLDLRTMAFRDYATPNAQGLPTIVDAPYAGHSARGTDRY